MVFAVVVADVALAVVAADVVTDVAADAAAVVSCASLCLMALVGTFCSSTGAVVEYDDAKPLL
mgnify:FL=1